MKLAALVSPTQASRPQFPGPAAVSSEIDQTRDEDQVDKSRAIQLPYSKADMVLGLKPSFVKSAARLTSISGLVDTSLGVAGIVGGVWGIKSGLEYLRQGKNVEAAAEFVGGVAGLAESGLSFMGGGPHIPILGSLGALSDGYKDVYVGLKQGLPERNKIGAAKMLAGTLMLGGGISANPWLTGLGALMYTGTVTYDNRSEIKDITHNVGHWIADHLPGSGKATVPL